MTKIIFSKRSETDLDEIYHFIAQDSEIYAKEVIDSILDTIYTLKEFNSIGSLYSRSLKYKRVRKFAYKNYSIFYSVENSTIFIITIVHQSRNVEL